MEKNKQTLFPPTYQLFLVFHYQTFFYSSKSFVSTHQISFLHPTTTNKILKACESKSKMRMVEQQRFNFFPKRWKRRKRKNEQRKAGQNNERRMWLFSFLMSLSNFVTRNLPRCALHDLICFKWWGSYCNRSASFFLVVVVFVNVEFDVLGFHDLIRSK